MIFWFQPIQGILLYYHLVIEFVLIFRTVRGRYLRRDADFKFDSFERILAIDRVSENNFISVNNFNFPQIFANNYN